MGILVIPIIFNLDIELPQNKVVLQVDNALNLTVVEIDLSLNHQMVWSIVGVFNMLALQENTTKSFSGLKKRKKLKTC